MKTTFKKNPTRFRIALLIGFSLFLVVFTVHSTGAQDDHTASEEAKGKIVWEKLRSNETNCTQLADGDFEVLGEYFMGQMTGTSHEAMNTAVEQMKGKEGEEQMHSALGKRLSGCDPLAAFPPQNVSFMQAILNMDSDQAGEGGIGSLSLIALVLLWIFVIGGIVVLIKRLIKRSRDGFLPVHIAASDISKERYGGGETNKQELEKKAPLPRFPFRVKIGTKLAFFLLLAGLFPMAVFGVLYIRNEQSALEKEIFNTLVLLAESKELRVFEYFKDITSRTHDFSSDGYIRDETKRLITTDSVKSQEALSRHLSVNKKPLDDKLAGISILDKDGTIIASTDQNEIGKNESDDIYFKEGKESSTLVRTDPGDVHFGIVSPFIVAVPLTDKDTHEFLGVLVNAFDSHKLESVLSSNFITRQSAALEAIVGKNPETLHVYIVDHEKNVILHPIRKEIDPVHDVGVSTLPVRECMEKGKEVVGSYIDHSGAEVLGASMCLVEEGMVLVVDIDKRTALLPVEQARMRFYGIITVLGALIVAISFLIARMLTKPIKALRESAEIVRTGNLHYRAKVATTGDEIEELGHAFNAMTASLEERQRWVEEEKKKLAVLLENLPLGVLMLRAPRGEIIALNGRGAALLGNDFENDPQRWERINKEDGERYPFEELPVNVALHTGHSITKNDLYMEEVGGRTLALRMAAVPVRDDAGTLRFVAVVFDDVTKEKEIDRSKTEFVSLASHQLRTPLSSINWYSEMLLDGDAGKITKEQKKYLQEIYRGNKRMVELVDALLNVSRIEMGTFMVEPVPMNVVAAATSILADLKKVIKKKKLVVKEVYAKDIPQIMADPKLMRVIFQNVLSNAVKYTPEEGNVSLALEVLKKGQLVDGRKVSREMLLITVADTGYGIPKGQQDRVFTKMFRADNVRERDPEGTGLGLYLVKSIVEHVSGNIWFESEEGKGSTFYITLPLEGMKKKEGARRLG
ncbi:MAG: ATP-binding protein [Patescibacteria group bacterium]